MTQAVPASIRPENLNTIAFLRMAAAQMRLVAQCAPEIAAELRDLAGDIEEEANDLQRDQT